MEEKIIQIIPAPTGIVAQHKEDEETTFDTPIVCFGLTNEGRVLPMNITNDGFIEELDPAELDPDFKSIEYGELLEDGKGNLKWKK